MLKRAEKLSSSKRGQNCSSVSQFNKRTFKTQKVPVLVTSESHQKCEGPFFRLGMFLSNAQKGIFSAVERDVLKNAEKVPLKRGVFKLSGRHFKFYWLEGVKGFALFYEYFGLNSLTH